MYNIYVQSLDPHDPLLPLILAIEMAQSGSRLSKLLNSVRRTEETDEEALARLISERAGIAKLLQKLEVPHDQFDISYRNSNIIDDLYKRLFKRPTKQGI